ncbi:MAG TPA: DMT family transporter [Firmicutes bacterium]|nr:DMT family transporter [Bacillota bacterium]
MLVFLLAIFGVICWGVAPVFGRLGLDKVDPITGLCLRTLIAATIVGSWLLATGYTWRLHNVPLRSWLLLGVEAIFATLLGDLAYYAALKLGKVSNVSLIMSTSPVITLWMAHSILGEQLTWLQIAGCFLIVLGLFLVGLQHKL